MSFSIGILGLPNVGKSTLFQALTKKQVNISNYPFCTREPNIGVVEVPDKRLEKLTEVSKPQKIIPAIIKFMDVAGLVKGAAKGEGLGNQFLAQVREADVILEVVRCFKNENISHITGEINPQRDIEIIETELILKDLETVEKRLKKVEKDVKQKDKKAEQEFKNLISLKERLEKGDTDYPSDIFKNLFLLSSKPIIYLLNCSENDISSAMKEKFKQENTDYFQLDLREELDKSELTKEEREELELTDPELSELIKKCEQALDLITFFTIVGTKEARARSIKKGSSILDGAGKIHSDFKDKFIQGEVLNWQKVVEAGSWKRCRELGLLKNVGKDYILENGDVIEIKL